MHAEKFLYARNCITQFHTKTSGYTDLISCNNVRRFDVFVPGCTKFDSTLPNLFCKISAKAQVFIGKTTLFFGFAAYERFLVKYFAASCHFFLRLVYFFYKYPSFYLSTSGFWKSDLKLCCRLLNTRL